MKGVLMNHLRNTLIGLSFLTLALFAGTASAQDTGGMMTGGDMTGGSMGEATVTGTLDLLGGGLTDADPTAALANIQSWQSQLAGSEDETLQTIAGQLDELYTALSSGSVDPQAASELLSSLGENTIAAAASVEGDTASQLTELGTLLSNAGASLGSD